MIHSWLCGLVVVAVATAADAPAPSVSGRLSDDRPSAAPPDVLLWSAAALVARRADTTTKATVAARQSLLMLADATLLEPADPVTDKQVVPPSGDVHDYWSVASYDWPCNVPCNHTLWSDCQRWCMPPMALPFLGQKCVDAGIQCNASSGLPWIVHDGFPRAADQTGRYLHGDRPRADKIVIDTTTLVLGVETSCLRAF